jgi:hypothetical protein
MGQLIGDVLMHINERPHGRGNDRAGTNLTWDLRNVNAGTTTKQFNRSVLGGTKRAKRRKHHNEGKFLNAQTNVMLHRFKTKQKQTPPHFDGFVSEELSEEVQQ